MCPSSFWNSVSSQWSFTDMKFYFFSMDIYQTLHRLWFIIRMSAVLNDQTDNNYSYEKYPAGNYTASCSFNFMKLFSPSPSSSQTIDCNTLFQIWSLRIYVPHRLKAINGWYCFPIAINGSILNYFMLHTLNGYKQHW